MKYSDALLWKLELSGAALCTALSLFLRELYTLCGRSLTGILFGAVNHSIWEGAKTLLLPLLIWGLLVQLSISPVFHRYLPVKVCAVSASLLLYIGLSASVRQAVGCALWAELSVTAVCAVFCAATTCLCYRSRLRWELCFAPAAVAVFLLAAFYFSFTPFPPHNALFLDPDTGMYGVIPEHIDRGAAALDAMIKTGL